MSDITKRDYAEWIEEFLKTINDEDPEKIMVASRNRDGTVNTGYYNCGVEDKHNFAAHILEDAMFAVTMANADRIVKRAQEMEEDNEGGNEDE